jgi:signal transduction histidine kinase
VALVLAVIAASVVSGRLSGSIVQPLLSLRRAAYDISDRQLPQLVDHVQRAESDDELPAVPPVEVKTDDEVEDVADAFNVVRDTAVDLAAQQARSRRNLSTMFVNLGRRNQGLLRKQLEFIDELERDESDTRLRGILFRLDHLATRMRRNAESLLVLAGEESPRIWTQPIPLSDVVRGAIAEVEEYERVDVRDVEDISVAGKAASDLSHLLAELIDNATTFSPPDSLVTVIGWGVADGYALSIVDDGIGMTDDELQQANERLRSATALHRVPSSHLGLFVVGGLAGRYSITVRLGESTGEGVVAKVILPRELLVQGTQPPPPVHAGAGASQYRQPTGGGMTSEYESALSWEGDGGTHEQPAPEPVRLGRTADNDMDSTADWVARRCRGAGPQGQGAARGVPAGSSGWSCRRFVTAWRRATGHSVGRRCPRGT